MSNNRKMSHFSRSPHVVMFSAGRTVAVEYTTTPPEETCVTPSERRGAESDRPLKNVARTEDGESVRKVSLDVG